MTGRLTHRSWLSTFGIALIGFLMISLLAACGSDDDDSDTNVDTANATSASSSTDAGDATVAAGDMDDAMMISACVQENTTGDIVNDLRDGDTGSTEDMYRECLGDSLPDSMVSQLDPIIEQAGECGSNAAADLSDDDVAAIEEGDEATIQRLSNATLECVSTDLGIDLQ